MMTDVSLAALSAFETLMSFIPSDLERKAYPVWFEPLLMLSCCMMFLMTGKFLRLSWYLGIVLPLATNMLYHTKGNVIDDYIIGITVTGWVVRVLDLALCNEPSKQFWKVEEEGSQLKPEAAEQKALPDRWPQSIFARFRWAMDLLLSLRAIGWNIQAKNVPTNPIQGQRKLHFLYRRIPKVFMAFMFVDIITYYRQTIAAPMVQSDSFWNIALQYQIILGWLTGIQVYNLLVMQYNLAAIVSTILGMCKPVDWPPLFGSFRPGHFWSTRRLWGNVWHQMMRRPCNFWGGLACDLTGAKRGTLRRRYTDLYAAFLFSVVIHGISSLNLRSKEHAIYQGLFFGMQPLMITLEDFVIFLGKSVGLRQNRLTEYIGFVVALGWISFSLRYMAAAENYVGWHSAKALPFSVVRPLHCHYLLL